MGAKHVGEPSYSEGTSVPGPEDEALELWDSGFGDVARSILTSAVECFSRKGFQATTTRDITAAVGLSPGALYVHFSSKEHVLFEIARTGHTSSLKVLKEVAVTDDAAAHLKTLVARFVAWHARHHIVGRVSQYELKALAPEHYEEIRELRRQSTAIFREVVTRGIEEGTFPETDVPRVVRAVLSMGVDLVRWYRPDGPDSPRELGDFYANLALSMLAGQNNMTDPVGRNVRPTDIDKACDFGK